MDPCPADTQRRPPCQPSRSRRLRAAPRPGGSRTMPGLGWGGTWPQALVGGRRTRCEGWCPRGPVATRA
eukprot:7192878-Pyramimonas_sp.AAC.1